MEYNAKPYNSYNSGTEFWRDNAISYSIEKAVIICRNYLNMQLKSEISNDERQFCWEVFMAMYEDTARRWQTFLSSGKADSAKLVYPYSLDEANKRMEVSLFHENRNLNQMCACAIDKAISESHYKTNYYNLELAVMVVVSKYGFERVNAILAHHIQNHKSDGRYSISNKNWAQSFKLPDNAFGFLASHATLIEDFTAYIRKLYTDLHAERFALPGQEEQGEDIVHGYKIIRSVTFCNGQGFVIGYNSDAVSPYVVWRFKTEEGQKEYFWGYYTDDEQSAADNYIAQCLFILQRSDLK